MRYAFEEPTTGGRLLLTVDEARAERREESGGRGAALMIAWNRGSAQTVCVDHALVRLPAGGVMTLMVNQPYRFERASRLVVWRFNREFCCVTDHDHEVSCPLFSGPRGTMVLRPDDADARRLGVLLDGFIEEFETRDDAQGEMLRLFLKPLIIRLTRLARTTDVLRALDPAQLDVVRRFNLLVEQHYRRYHRVQDYARMLHRSPKTLANLFARSGQRSPLQLIRERIALEAKRQLRYTDRSAKQIAYDLGFDDPAAFSRFFKAEVGESPTEFRGARPGNAA